MSAEIKGLRRNILLDSHNCYDLYNILYYVINMYARHKLRTL
jgi:hypothetical protein